MSNGSGWSLRGSVWATGQTSPKAQREGYAPAGTPHPAKMLPAIARHAVFAYTRPGGVVLDPMCGTGTSLVEAVRAGRHAIGVEYESRWAAVAVENLHRARGLRGDASIAAAVMVGDARDLVRLLPRELQGAVDLVVTSPPYGSMTHGRVSAGADGVTKFNAAYGDDAGNLAYRPLPEVVAGLVAVFAGCRALLAPGGKVVVTARPFRRQGVLVDFPGLVVAAAIAAGLEPFERGVALLASWRDGQLSARPSFFQLANTRKATTDGRPTAVVVHEDVLVFTTPADPGGDLIPGRREPSSVIRDLGQAP